LKQFILGISCGLILSAATVAYAADSIQASLFPVTFEFNGQPRELGNEYATLNYNGHVYVPARFMAENLGAVIEYDAEQAKIIIKNGPLDVYDHNFGGASVGNFIVTGDGTRTKVTGQLKIENLPDEQNSVDGRLFFYNSRNEKIGEAPIEGSNFGKSIRDFTTYGEGDFTKFARVEMRILSINGMRVGKNAPADDKMIPLTEILNDPLTDMDKIEITYGPGRKLIVNDEEEIRTIGAKLREIHLLKLLDQTKRVGYLYFMDIYAGGKIMRYINTLQLDGVVYQHTPLTDALDRFIAALEHEQ
jgi:hypothetical protein